MPKLTFIGLYFWICLAQKVVSGDLYHEVGGKLVLTPDKSSVTDPITSILWKHGKNKVAEWDKDFGGLDIYADFKERTTLDNTTGELKISGLMKTDSGVYSVEFNSKLLDKTYKLSVIKAVPKPKITSSCNANQTSCTLTCEGDTTDAEPVTYRWKVAEGAWEVGVKQFNVFKSDTGQSNNGYKYICKLNNTVSGKVSEPVGEVFGPEPSNTSTIVVGVVILVLAAVVTGLLVWKKKTRYPHNTWIDFLRKFFCARFVAESKTDGCAAPVGEDESKPDGCAAPVDEDESKTDGCAAPVDEDESKTDGCAAPVDEDESKTDGCAAPVGEDESKTDGCAAPVGEDESKTDGCAAPVGEDESKTGGCAAPVGEDESKTDDCAAPVGEDESKMDGSTAPGADLNAADGEAKGGKDDSYCRTTGNCGPEVRRGS
ncbi:SLAM family member 7-like isoform X2 [Oncorhynchus clarkii lewisi]|uniref:SLAM family member 7-like isoform X2 n=1 Tax=Oncorhynchus clarkii lewisi TaxID=490388 RepID=UPI0039B8D843